MYDIFTHREKHVLVIVVVTFIVIALSGVDQQTLEAWSIPAMIFYVAPIGLYIATDPERLKKNE